MASRMRSCDYAQDRVAGSAQCAAAEAADNCSSGRRAGRGTAPSEARSEQAEADGCVRGCLARRVKMLPLVRIGPNADSHGLQLRTENNIPVPNYSAAGGKKQRQPRDKSACAPAVRPVATGQPRDHSGAYQNL